MSVLDTKYFGTVNYPEEAVIQFPCGLPGFEEEKQFLMMEPAARAPLTFLQSLQRPGLCFLAAPIQGLYADYQPAITLEDLECLGLDPGRQPRIGAEIWCLALIVVAKNGQVTANLLAPVMINRANLRGRQAIPIGSIF